MLFQPEPKQYSKQIGISGQGPSLDLSGMSSQVAAGPSSQSGPMASVGNYFQPQVLVGDIWVVPI